MSSRNVEGVNTHALNAKVTYPGSNGRTNCELEILYYNERIILSKLNELHLLCGDLSFHIVYIVESWLDDPVLDNELTIFSYSLGGGGLLHIRDLSLNAMLMDNMDLPLHNCSRNHFCLYALYSLPSTSPPVLQQITAIDLCRKLTFVSNPILYAPVN